MELIEEGILTFQHETLDGTITEFEAHGVNDRDENQLGEQGARVLLKAWTRFKVGDSNAEVIRTVAWFPIATTAYIVEA